LSRIFISHSSADEDIAREVGSALAGAGLGTWLDVEQIAPGDSFLEMMNEGLADASYVLVLISAASLTSKWVSKEWMAAMASHGTVLIPLLLESVELPPLLRDIVHIDFRDRARGVERLLGFFRRELGPVGDSPRTRPRRMAEPELETLAPRELRLVAVACLTTATLDAFLIDAEIGPGEVGGASLNERINSLLHKVNRDGLALTFAEWLRLEEPRCFERNLLKVRTQQRWKLESGAG
jgi:TIR domain